MGFFDIGKKFHTCSIHNYTGTGECPDCISAYYKMKSFINCHVENQRSKKVNED